MAETPHRPSVVSTVTAKWRNPTPQMIETPPHPFVISTEAGQPPIGKPLIVQARGQLRLTWRLYAESPQSGEISLSRGLPQAGDLSTQRLNSPEVFIPIPPCPSARDDGGGRRHTVISKAANDRNVIPHLVISTAAEPSGVKKSPSPMVCRRQAACHHGAVIKKGCEEMMTISSQPFFKKEYQMRIMLPAAKRRQ